MTTKTRSTKSRRWEARVDAETDALAAEAAAALGVTKSVFIAEAARERAERTLARADLTLIAEDVFDDLIASLDAPELVPALERLAARPRRYRRA